MTTSPLQYLDKAMSALRDLGLVPERTDEAPIIALLNQISDLDEARIVGIARTLNQAATFNEVVREQITAMEIGERYGDITAAFDSVRDDAKEMVDQLADGKISTWERMQNAWTNMTRGDISSRFGKIKDTYLEVAKDTKDQIEREQTILNAYLDFRGALKQAEIMAAEVLQTAEAKLKETQQAVNAASQAIEGYVGADAAERGRLELARDEAMRALQDEEKRFQIAKDVSDNLTIGYNTSETIMARLVQTTNAKERIYAQSVSFFGTNDSVLTALSASFTGLHGLHESTQTLNAMKDGINKSLETLAEVGGKVQEAALKAGYGPTIQAESLKKLVDSVVSYQEHSREIIAEMRDLSTRNAEEVRTAVEGGKRRLAALAAQGNVLTHD